VNVFLVLIVIVLIGLTAAAVMGKFGGFMADATSSQSFGGVTAGPLSTDDLAQVHFDQALRGYRMNQVDEVIDACSARLRELESEVAALSAGGAASPGAGDAHEASSEPAEQ
jgi:DivIVA domain-containing protein